MTWTEMEWKQQKLQVQYMEDENVNRPRFSKLVEVLCCNAASFGQTILFGHLFFLSPQALQVFERQRVVDLVSLVLELATTQVLAAQDAGSGHVGRRSLSKDWRFSTYFDRIFSMFCCLSVFHSIALQCTWCLEGNLGAVLVEMSRPILSCCELWEHDAVHWSNWTFGVCARSRILKVPICSNMF